MYSIGQAITYFTELGNSLFGEQPKERRVPNLTDKVRITTRNFLLQDDLLGALNYLKTEMRKPCDPTRLEYICEELPKISAMLSHR
jgi:hypothetical protein